MPLAEGFWCLSSAATTATELKQPPKGLSRATGKLKFLKINKQIQKSKSYLFLWTKFVVANHSERNYSARHGGRSQYPGNPTLERIKSRVKNRRIHLKVRDRRKHPWIWKKNSVLTTVSFGVYVTLSLLHFPFLDVFFLPIRNFYLFFNF